MNRVIDIALEGQANPFRLHEDAYDALSRYLDGARSGVTDDADRAEVIGDLERSIGARLSARLSPSHGVLTIEDIEAVLAEVGPVGAASDRPAPARAASPRRRRLYRIDAGKQLAGVCTGLSAYSEIRVDWVRTLVLLGTVVTGGLGLLVYIGMAFVLPVVPTREAWLAAQDQADGA